MKVEDSTKVGIKMQWFMELNSICQTLLATVFTCALTGLGSALVFFSKQANQKVIGIMTGGAAGIMIAACFFSLLLPAIQSSSSLPNWMIVTVGFLIGGLFICLSDLILSKIKKTGKEGKKSSVLFFSVVTLHNIPEGMVIGISFASVLLGDTEALLAAFMLPLSVAIQNIPEGMCVAYSLHAEGKSPLKSFLLSWGSGMIEWPAGVLGVVAASLATEILPWILSFSAGAIIAVVCSELIPEALETHKGTATLGLICGFALMVFLNLLLG